MSGCETSETNGVQNRIFSRFESARFDNWGSIVRRVGNGTTSLKNFWAGEAEETAYLGVGDIYVCGCAIVELHGVYWEELTKFFQERFGELLEG